MYTCKQHNYWHVGNGYVFHAAIWSKHLPNPLTLFDQSIIISSTAILSAGWQIQILFTIIDVFHFQSYWNPKQKKTNAICKWIGKVAAANCTCIEYIQNGEILIYASELFNSHAYWQLSRKFYFQLQYMSCDCISKHMFDTQTHTSEWASDWVFIHLEWVWVYWFLIQTNSFEGNFTVYFSVFCEIWVISTYENKSTQLYYSISHKHSTDTHIY